MKKTSISYVDFPGSPWTVCTPVTEGCLKCFARTQALRRGWCKAWGPGVPRRAFKTYRERMLKLEREPWVCECGEWFKTPALHDCSAGRYTVNYTTKMHHARVLFDLGDWLDDEVPPEMLADALDVVRLTPHVDHFWPTKRPELFARRMGGIHEILGSSCREETWEWIYQWSDAPLKNFFPGVSISAQPDADKFVPDLLHIPAAHHWVSVEPMLGPVSMKKWFWDYGMARRWAKKTGERIDLVVIGCESSGSHLGRLSLFNQSVPPNKHADEAKWWGWVIALVRECKESGVPVHVKQIPLNGKLSHNPADGWPEELNVRETI